MYQGLPQAGKPDCTLTLADEDMLQIVSNQSIESGFSNVRIYFCMAAQLHHFTTAALSILYECTLHRKSNIVYNILEHTPEREHGKRWGKGECRIYYNFGRFEVS